MKYAMEKRVDFLVAHANRPGLVFDAQLDERHMFSPVESVYAKMALVDTRWSDHGVERIHRVHARVLAI